MSAQLFDLLNGWLKTGKPIWVEWQCGNHPEILDAGNRAFPLLTDDFFFTLNRRGEWEGYVADESQAALCGALGSGGHDSIIECVKAVFAESTRLEEEYQVALMIEGVVK